MHFIYCWKLYQMCMSSSFRLNMIESRKTWLRPLYKWNIYESIETKWGRAVDNSRKSEVEEEEEAARSCCHVGDEGLSSSNCGRTGPVLALCFPLIIFYDLVWFSESRQIVFWVLFARVILQMLSILFSESCIVKYFCYEWFQ